MLDEDHASRSKKDHLGNSPRKSLTIITRDQFDIEHQEEARDIDICDSANNGHSREGRGKASNMTAEWTKRPQKGKVGKQPFMILKTTVHFGTIEIVQIIHTSHICMDFFNTSGWDKMISELRTGVLADIHVHGYLHMFNMYASKRRMQEAKAPEQNDHSSMPHMLLARQSQKSPCCESVQSRLPGEIVGPWGPQL